MNALGRDALRAAALAGVRQIFGKMHDSYGGRCGLGVLHNAAAPEPNVLALYDLNHCAQCPVCGDATHEYPLVAHLQDVHGADFLKIASLMPVSEERAR